MELPLIFRTIDPTDNIISYPEIIMTEPASPFTNAHKEDNFTSITENNVYFKSIGNNNNINNNQNISNQSQNSNQKNISINNQENNINQNNERNNNNNSNNSINRRPKHGKNSFDSLRRKLKKYVKKYSFEFINKQINDKDNKIKLIEYSQIQNTKKDFEEKFMYQTLGNIFSTKISNKYKTIKDKENYNKKKIIQLCKGNKRLKKIFNISFIDCLNHFIGKKTIQELKEMTTFDDIEFKDNENKKNLKLYALDYEQKVKDFKARKPKRMKKENK